MKNNITVSEKQLDDFFGVKGSPLDSNMQWPFNDYLYEVSRNDMEISFSIHPAIRDVRIILSKGKDKIFESNRMAVSDVTIETKGDNRSLVVHCGDSMYLLIRVDPYIQIEDYYGDLDSP